MAATLFKLAITADTTTTVDTKPTVSKYFYTVNTADIDAGVLTIPAASFVDDNGDAVVEITTADADNGYYMLFINGVLQQEALFTVTSANVVVQDADDIKQDEPVILVVTNFEADASSTTTVET